MRLAGRSKSHAHALRPAPPSVQPCYCLRTPSPLSVPVSRHRGKERGSAANANKRKRVRTLTHSLLDDHIEAREPDNPSAELINADFSPTPASERTWSSTDMASFWVALVISVPTFLLASGLIELGMSWQQALATILAGNSLTLLPMIANAHPGTKYGIPFPVLARSSFGILGANVPSLARAFVACGWFGIQTWVGGSCIHQMLSVLGLSTLVSAPHIAWLGITASQLACFAVFWAAQVWIVLTGMESIRILERYSAPVLILLSLLLLAWAVSAAGGFGPMLSTPSQFGVGMPKAGQFWSVFWPSITAQVGFWATLSLNIPDFTRYATSQRAQALGQAAGLPLTMVLFSFLGLAVTSATIVIYGAPITDPVQLLGRLEGTVPIVLSLFGLTAATLTTNIAANIVAPANAFINMSPKTVSFRAGALLAAGLGALVQPWKLVSSTSSFINTWLVGYSVLLGPIMGIIVTDYHVINSRQLNVDGLYQWGPGPYWFKGGFNPAAMAALIAGVLPCLPGLLQQTGLVGASLHPVWNALYSCAWFVGFAVSSAVYLLLSSTQAGPASKPAMA